MRLHYGQVIWAKVRDHNGFEKKRPLLILNPDDEITASLPLVCAAITTRFKAALSPAQISLPWTAPDQGRSPTGLWKPCVVALDWMIEVDHGDVVRILGQLPEKVLKDIQQRLEQLEAGDD